MGFLIRNPRRDPPDSETSSEFVLHSLPESERSKVLGFEQLKDILEQLVRQPVTPARP